MYDYVQLAHARCFLSRAPQGGQELVGDIER